MIECRLYNKDGLEVDHTTWFTHKKKKNSLVVREGPLEPSRVAMLGNLRMGYRNQLEKIMFDENKEADFKELLPLLIIVDKINKGKVPIYVEFSLSKGANAQLTKVLCEFVRDNFTALNMILSYYAHQPLP